jgi:hypothetical protein
MQSTLAEFVRKRAKDQCEYCCFPQSHDFLTFEIDHIIAVFHDGPTVASNLALACFWCNNFKGTNLAGIDPQTKRITRLYHPRRHKWSRHFTWEGPVLRGRSAIGRTTIVVLRINLSTRVEFRAALAEEGLFPP